MSSFSEGFTSPCRKHKPDLWRPIPFRFESSGSLTSTLVSNRYISGDAAQKFIAEMMPLRAEGAKGILYGWVQSVTCSGGITRVDVLWQQGGAIPDAAGDLSNIYVAPRGQYPNDWPRAIQNWKYLAVYDTVQRSLMTSASVQEISSALRINIPCAGKWEIEAKMYIRAYEAEYRVGALVSISTASTIISNPETDIIALGGGSGASTQTDGLVGKSAMQIETTGPQTLFIVGLAIEYTPSLAVNSNGKSPTMIYVKPDGI